MVVASRRLIGLVAAATVALAACGTAQPVLQDPDLPSDGRELFEMPALVSKPGCITCHSIEPGQVLVGPSLAGIGAAAGTRVDGLDAERYLRQSIVDPGAYVVEGFRDDLMPGDYVTILNDEQIAALVEYMEGL